MKKVLLIVIDALATRIVYPAAEAGRLPNLKELMDRGAFHPRCTSIFPSITPAATCTIATGAYPREHGIAGAHWYDRERDEVAYFGDDIWAILEEGIGQYIHDFQIELNARRLRIPTIFELVEEANLLDCCLNYMWYKGRTKHSVDTPLLLKLMPGFSLDSDLKGPSILCLGDFVTGQTNDAGPLLKGRGGLTRRFGFHDDNTADRLIQLATEGMPDFTLAYFPNNDFESHRVGPAKAEPVLQAFDQTLGQLFEAFGGIEETLEQLAIFITGDHSQSDLFADEVGINVDEVLADFSVVPAGRLWESQDDLIVCPNMRAAQIYFRPGAWERKEDVVHQLLTHPGIDQVIWSECFGNGDKSSYKITVATSDRGRLQFWSGDSGDHLATDCYGATWSWTGDLEAVDASVNNDQVIEFGDYPNAFERIAGSLFDHSGEMWVTARLGHEFWVPNTSVRKAGSHGSLHTLDSSAPLIAAGLPADFPLPEHPRTVDVMALCLSVLGIEPARPAGASHAPE